MSKVDALQINMLTRCEHSNKNCNEGVKKPTEKSQSEVPLVETLLRCKKCDFECRTKIILSEHYEREHPKPLFNCDACEFVTIHNNQLEKHKRTANPPHKFQCELCSYKGLHKNDIGRHKNTMHNEEPFNCDNGDFETLDENIIIKQVQEVHNPAKKSRTFFSQAQTRHPDYQTKSNARKSCLPSTPSPTYSKAAPSDVMAMPSQQENFYCEECEKHFSEKDQFELHNMFYHGATNNQ